MAKWAILGDMLSFLVKNNYIPTSSKSRYVSDIQQGEVAMAAIPQYSDQFKSEDQGLYMVRLTFPNSGKHRFVTVTLKQPIFDTQELLMRLNSGACDSVELQQLFDEEKNNAKQALGKNPRLVDFVTYGAYPIDSVDKLKEQAAKLSPESDASTVIELGDMNQPVAGIAGVCIGNVFLIRKTKKLSMISFTMKELQAGEHPSEELQAAYNQHKDNPEAIHLFGKVFGTDYEQDGFMKDRNAVSALASETCQQPPHTLVRAKIPFTGGNGGGGQRGGWQGGGQRQGGWQGGNGGGGNRQAWGGQQQQAPQQQQTPDADFDSINF